MLVFNLHVSHLKTIYKKKKNISKMFHNIDIFIDVLQKDTSMAVWRLHCLQIPVSEKEREQKKEWRKRESEKKSEIIFFLYAVLLLLVFFFICMSLLIILKLHFFRFDFVSLFFFLLITFSDFFFNHTYMLNLLSCFNK